MVPGWIKGAEEKAAPQRRRHTPDLAAHRKTLAEGTHEQRMLDGQLGKVARRKAEIKGAQERLSPEKKLADQNSARFAALFEAVIRDGIAGAPSTVKGVAGTGWLGKNLETQFATEYDDIFAGVDCVVRIPLPGGRIETLGVDATYTSDPTGLNKKLGRAVGELMAGEGTRLAHSAGAPGTVVPGEALRVVVALSNDAMREAVREWLLMREAGEVVAHPLQKVVATQIRAQVAKFAKLARDAAGEPGLPSARIASYEALAARYEAVYEFLSQSRIGNDTKSKNLDEPVDYAKDPVHLDFLARINALTLESAAEPGA